MKQKIFRLISTPIIPSLLLGLFVTGIANASVPGMPSAPTLVTTTANLDAAVFCPVIDIMFWVLISISIVMVLWAAYLYVISEGESEKPSQARRMLLYAAIGIVIALAAKGFPDIVGSLFNTSTTFGLAC